MRSAQRTSPPPSNLLYLLEWTPQLLLFSCLERCDIYLRVATIPGWLAFKVCACACYCPHMIYIIVQRTWQAKASGQSILFRQHCAWALCLPDGVDSISGGGPDCYPRVQERPQQACCVCEGWRNHRPCTTHRMFSSLQQPFPVIHTVSSHLELL